MVAEIAGRRVRLDETALTVLNRPGRIMLTRGPLDTLTVSNADRSRSPIVHRLTRFARRAHAFATLTADGSYRIYAGRATSGRYRSLPYSDVISLVPQGAPPERVWEGAWGDSYVERTAGKDWRAEVTLFEEILDGRRPESILEVGCNVGLNLLAIHELLPDAQLAGIEPNENAVRAAPRMADVRVGVANRLPFPGGSFDLVFTRAVLMHLSPETYAETFKEMRRVARRWLLLIEPPAEIREGILYAGRDDVAFADDWARICRQAVPDARLLGEGRADYLTNWWLFELSSGPSERER